MKSILSTLTLILVLSATAFSQKRTITVSELPKDILSYIQLHFPEDGMLKLTEENDGEKNTYEILLDNQAELEFDSEGTVTEIEGKEKLPISVIPSGILDYVSSNYPKNFISKWKLEGDHQAITLDNDLELEFTMEGEFISIAK